MSRPGSPRPRPNISTSRPRRFRVRLWQPAGWAGRSVGPVDTPRRWPGRSRAQPRAGTNSGPRQTVCDQAPGHREKSPVPRKSERHAPLERAGSRRRLPVAGSRPSEDARLTATVPLQVTTSAVMPARSRTRHRSPTVCRWGSCPGRPRRSDCRRSRRCRMWSGCPTH